MWVKYTIPTGYLTKLYFLKVVEFVQRADSYCNGYPSINYFVIFFSRHVTINDPLRKNPISNTGTYRLPFVKFSNAVMLGILTYDENLLVIAKK